MQVTFEGIYRDGTVELAEEVPFQGERRVLVIFPDIPPAPPVSDESESSLQERIAELDDYFSCVRVKTKGWKFNRDEANER